MNKKIISFWILLVSFFSIWFWYSLVFAWNLWEIEFKLSDNIFLDSFGLNKTKILIKTKENLDNISISWECWVSGKIIEKTSNYYIFEVFLTQEKCTKQNIKATFSSWDLNLETIFNIASSYSLYSTYLDYSDVKLKKYLSNIDAKILNLKSFETYNKSIHLSKYDFLRENRKLQELKYLREFIYDLVKKREEKYITPIKWSSLTTVPSKLPNAWRPYRESYTNWVHEWWDFDTNFWETVVSLDYWLVIRVVDKFDFVDLDKLKTTWELTQADRIKNLDILRGKQVWVKTMKWDVAFYSHLNEVYSNIKVWDVVFKWQALWTVWITWVPDKNYTDYHLHIEVRKNPYIDTRKIPYSVDEYMKWNWYFKWESEKYILENQYNIFWKNE